MVLLLVLRISRSSPLGPTGMGIISKRMVSENGTRQVVAGILDGNHGMAVFHQMRDDVEAVLKSGADDDLFRVADHTARTFQILLNDAAQPPFSLGITILDKLPGTFAQGFHEKLAP